MMFERASTILLDFQYINGNKRQIFIKELAFMEGNNLKIHHHHFLPPFPEAELDYLSVRTNTYCRDHLNFLDWNNGNVSYLEVEPILRSLDRYETVLVHGTQKRDFLRNKYKMTNVEILDEMPSYKSMFKYQHTCPTHLPNVVYCAYSHVFSMFLYLIENKKFLEK